MGTIPVNVCKLRNVALCHESHEKKLWLLLVVVFLCKNLLQL